MTDLWNDVRHAFRGLRLRPGFALTTVLTLGLGIGANVAIFSVVNGVLLRPLPFNRPDQLVRVWGLHPEIGREAASLPDFLDWRAGVSSFAGLSALANTRFTLTGAGEPEMIRGAAVTADFFGTLGVAPLRGRTFATGEDTRAAARVVVLGEGLWRRRFGGDPSIVGSGVQLSGTTYVVIGVVPSSASIQGPIDAWTTLATDTTLGRRSDFLTVVGRLRPAATLESARLELATIARRLTERYPGTNAGWSVDVLPLRDSLVGSVRSALAMFMAAVGLVLLVGCANVANLMLARTASREREVIIRTALGASRLRLLQELLTESVLLALLGGILGVTLAAWSLEALASLARVALPRADEIGLDLQVLLFALALSLITGLLFGLASAIRLADKSLSGALRGGARAFTGGPAVRRLRGILVLGEVAAAFTLLIGAGLLIRSFDRLLQVDPGFRTDGLFTARVLLPRTRYSEGARQSGFMEGLVERFGAMPAVRSAAVVSDAPLGDSPLYLAVAIQGRSAAAPGAVEDAEVFSASPGYFAVLGIPVLQGRSFDSTDRADAPPVGVVNRAMARRFFGGRSPIGARLTFGNPTDSTAQWLTVVGVVGDIHHAGLSEPPYPQIYLPAAQSPSRWMVLVARSATPDPLALAPAARRALASLDPDLALSDVSTMERRIADATAHPRVSAVLLGAFALLALVLAAIGIYGVVSYGVVQRTRELGIRVALGAEARAVSVMVIRQGMGPVAGGVVIGMVAAWAGARALRSQLFQVGPADPVTFAVVTTCLAGTALLACYLPARRAALADPVEALRSE